MNILVTGVGGASVGEQIIFALRSAKTPYRIIAVDADPNSLGLQRADKGYLVPKAIDESYLNKILEACKIEDIKVLIPGSEVELVKISENRSLFEDQGILPLINDNDVIKLCLNKWKTHLFLKNNKFGVPESHLWENGDNTTKLKYPVIIKPYVGTGGSRFVFIAQNNNELSFFGRFLKRQGCSPMVQRYVGSAENEYTVGVLTSLEGELISSIAIKRRLVGRLSTLYVIRNYRDDATPLHISTGISQGVIDDFEEIRKNAEKIALKLGSKGPLNIQCRIAEEEISVFEINPRFSGTESLRALAGYNAPDALIRKHVLGEDIKELTYKTGIVSRGLANHFTSFEV